MIHVPMTFRTGQEGWRFAADVRMADLAQEAQRHKEESRGVREEAYQCIFLVVGQLVAVALEPASIL